MDMSINFKKISLLSKSNKMLLTAFIIFTSLLQNSLSAPASIADNSSSFMKNLQNHTQQNKCLFPLQSITGSFYKSVDSSCKPPVNGKQTFDSALCIVISDQIYQICNKTKGAAGAGYKALSIRVADIPAIKESKNVSTFCTDWLTDVPDQNAVPKEVEGLYSPLIDPSDKNPCVSVCQNLQTTTGEKKPPSEELKIKPLCILLQVTSSVRKNVDDKDKIASSSSKTDGGNPNPMAESEVAMGDEPKAAGADKKSEPPSIKKDEKPSENKVADGTGDQKNSAVPNSPNGSISGMPKPPSSPSTVESGANGQQQQPSNSNISPVPVPAGSSSSTTSTPTSIVAGVNGEELPPPLAGEMNKKSSPAPPQVKPKPAEDKPKNPDDADYDDAQVPVQPEMLDPSSLDGDLDFGLQENKKPPVMNKEETGSIGMSPGFTEDGDSGYFNYFLFFVTFLALSFLVFHNKRRLIAYVIEGKKPRQSRSRRRSSSASGGASYRRLENNFE